MSIKSMDTYELRIPWEPFGGRPDSLMIEVYLTQDLYGLKRSAFDSVPPDDTLDLDFDWENPQPGEWDVALEPVYLGTWGQVYRTRDTFPEVPTINGAAVFPEPQSPGQFIQVTADVTDEGGGIGAVVSNLVELGGDVEANLYDDGDPAHGDVAGGDGIFSQLWEIPERMYPDRYEIEIRAYDIDFIQFFADTCAAVIRPGIPLVHATDPQYDDHGPNQAGEPRKYYEYPDNQVFIEGAFDLIGFRVDRVDIDHLGEIEERLAFTVRLDTFPDPSIEGHADWNPLYADLNIEKFDILIDSAPGGAISSLPGRGAGYQPWDGWEFAIILDGWFKAVIPSLGSNDPDDWRDQSLSSDEDILLVSNYFWNTVTALVSPGSLGNPTDEEIASWDICVQAASHDSGGSEVFGGTRWVNEISTEWNFGGGSNGSNDANLIDLLLLPGLGKPQGRPQEYILDYESPEALDRLELGLVPVAIEIEEDPGISGVGLAPRQLLWLFQNVPNPFNPTTTIAFELPAPEAVSLYLYDLQGRLVRTLLRDQVCPQGHQEVVWDGRDESCRLAASGTYFFRLEAGGQVETKRAVLVK